MSLKKTIFIAHRGESFDAPENTLAAINLAWERDADAVEIDVQMSKDNEIVVIHDQNTYRFSGIFENVKDQMLEELRHIDVGSYKGSKWKNEKIPTLDDVLKSVPDEKNIFIEIKCGSEIIPVLKQTLHQSALYSHQVKLIGFSDITMTALKKELPHYEVFLIFDVKYNRQSQSFTPSTKEMIAKAQEADADGIDVFACDAVDKKLVDQVKNNDLKIYLWTVNDPNDARKFIEAGVDGITSDRPFWLKKQL